LNCLAKQLRGELPWEQKKAAFTFSSVLIGLSVAGDSNCTKPIDWVILIANKLPHLAKIRFAVY